jgi:hypothetical protein
MIVEPIQRDLEQKIRQAHASLQQAHALLATAKRAVEVAIEEGEEKALQLLEA